jgi:hypothetical protein
MEPREASALCVERQVVSLRVAVVALAVMAGCASYPRPPDTTWVELLPASELPGTSLGRAVVTGCEPEPVEPPACEQRIAALAAALRSTGLFREVAERALERHASDVTIVVLGTPRRKHHPPVHNPGALLLSLAVPLWWSEPAGYAFAVRRGNAPAARIDTTWEGTVVAWGGAPLLSIVPSRTLLPTRAAETARLTRALQELFR